MSREKEKRRKNYSNKWQKIHFNDGSVWRYLISKSYRSIFWDVTTIQIADPSDKIYKPPFGMVADFGVCRPSDVKKWIEENYLQKGR